MPVCGTILDRKESQQPRKWKRRTGVSTVLAHDGQTHKSLMSQQYSVPWVIWSNTLWRWSTLWSSRRTTMTRLHHTGKLTSSRVRLRKHQNLMYPNYKKAFVSRKWNRSSSQNQQTRDDSARRRLTFTHTMELSAVSAKACLKPGKITPGQGARRSTHRSEKSKSDRAAPCVQSQNDWRYQAHGHFAVVRSQGLLQTKGMCIVNFSKHLAIENEKGIHIQTVVRT